MRKLPDNSQGLPSTWMKAKTHRLEVALETVLESIDLAEGIVTRVSEAAGFGEEDVHKIGMAVREGVVNAYNYGNRQDRGKKIFLTIEFDPDRMAVHVLDEGPGFNEADVPDCLAEENLLRTSGRGLFLMRAFMDEFCVQRGPSGGAELVMVKNLPKSASGNGTVQAS
jgi:serine/threonine-protein kinase RsbW